MKPTGNFDRWADVPAEARERAKYFVEVRNAHTGRLLVRGYMECWEASNYHIELINPIVDSSDRHEGILLKERWSLHSCLIFGGAIIWTCHETRKEDRVPAAPVVADQVGVEQAETAVKTAATHESN